jgi:hypothetical protein
MRRDVPVILLGVSHRKASVEMRGQLVSVNAPLTFQLRSALGAGAIEESA